MEIKEFRNSEEVELYFFKDLEFLKENNPIIQEIKLDNFIRHNWKFNVLKVLGFVEGQVVCVEDGNDNFFAFEKDGLQVGDFILKGNGKDKIISIDKGLINYEWESEYRNIIDYEDIEDEVILTREVLIQKVKEVKERSEEEELNLNKEREQVEEVKSEEEKEEERKFKEESIGEFSDFKVDKNIIEDTSSYRSLRFTFKKNVNEVFEYNYLLGYHSGYSNGNFSRIELRLIQEKIDYIKEEKISIGNYIEKYEVEFGEKPKVNGVDVNNSKLKFILGKLMNTALTEDNIKLLLKLTGMKVDLLELKQVMMYSGQGEHNYLDISVNIIDEEHFKVEFLNKEKDFEWKYLRDKFFCDGRSRTISGNMDFKEITEFAGMFGISKQEFLDCLKKVMMLNKLREGEEEK